MSLLREETMRVIAQSVGFEDLSDECVRELLPEVEFRVREIIQDALKFRDHAKKSHLTTQHINLALQARNVERLYGFGSGGKTKFRRCEEQQTLFFAEDDELEVNEILNTALPQVPIQPSFHVHWLAVEGVQPLIAENEVVEGDHEDGFNFTLKEATESASQAERKPLVKHVLTEEMQLYFSKVTRAIKSEEFELQRAAFASLSQDPGIHQLLPYLSRFVYEEVKHATNDLDLLFALMRTCKCLLSNPNLHVELYLHQLLPAILTCVLSKQLCENPADDHWALRKYAALLAAQICKRFGETYQDIQARVSKLFHQAMTDSSSPFTTQYGALHGIMYLGPLVMETLLFSSLGDIYERFETALSCSNSSLVERLEAQQCVGILVHACGRYFASSQSRPPVAEVNEIVYDAFGESLVPYVSQVRASTDEATPMSTSSRMPMVNLCI